MTNPTPSTGDSALRLADELVQDYWADELSKSRVDEAAATLRSLAAQRDELVAGLRQISARCPAYKGEWTREATLSDFGFNGDDYAREMSAMDEAVTGDIARALLSKVEQA